MQIFENEIMVGLVDESTLVLTKVQSPKLKTLIRQYKTTGMEFLGGGEAPEDGAVSGDAMSVFKLTPERIGMLHSALREEGFETFPDE